MPARNTGLTAPEGEQLNILLACLIGDSGKTEGDCPFGTTNRSRKYNRNEWRILLNGGTVRKAAGGGY